MRTHIIVLLLMLPLSMAGQAIEVMTYNIRCGECDNHNTNNWDSRKTLVLSVIQKNDPDIIGFQEMIPAQLEYLSNQLTSYSYYGTGREADGSGEGCYIFYKKDRFSLDSLHSGTKWYSSTPEIPGSNDWGDMYKRIVSYARFRIKSNNQYFYLFNTHLTYIDSLQIKYVNFLISLIKSRHPSDPFILTGDFNADEASAAILHLKMSFPADEIMDTYREIVPNEKISTFNNFSDVRDGRKIDYIFAEGKRFKTLSAQCDTTTFKGKYPSDHFALTATLELKIQK